METEFILYKGTVPYRIDLDADVIIPLNFNTDDLVSLGDRKTTFSKTIKIPGTKNNNKIFNHIYQINSDGDFNPLLKIRAVVKSSGLTIFDGVMCMDGITETIGEYIKDIEYNVTLFGETLNIFSLLGNLTIADLDFSKYDHNFDLNTIRVSWPAYFIGGSINAGMTYVNDATLSPEDYIPNQTILYSAPAVSSISSQSYNGNLCVGIYFVSNHSFSVGDSLYVQTDNKMLAGTQVIAAISSTGIVLHMAWANLLTTAYTGLFIESRRWDAFGYWYPMIDNGTYAKLLGPNDVIRQSHLYTVSNFDTGDYFDAIAKDPVTGLPISPTNGTTFLVDDGASVANTIIQKTLPQVTSGSLITGAMYVINIYRSNDDFSNVGGPPPDALNLIHNGYSFTSTGGTPTVWAGGSTLTPTVYTHENATLQHYTTKSEGGTLFSKQDTPNHWYATDFIPHIFAREVWVKLFELIGYSWDFPLMDTDLFRRLVIPMDQNFNMQDVNSITGLPDRVIMNDWLPKVKLTDFFISILNIANSVILENKSNRYSLNFVCRSNFFNGTTFNLKRDASKEISIQLASGFLPKKYIFKYKDCSDFYNTDYKKDFGVIDGRTYGDYFVDTLNEFTDKNKTIELIFEPTVMVGKMTGQYDVFNPGYGQDKVFSASYYANDDGQNVSRKASCRLLIAGLRGTAYPWSFSGASPGGGFFTESMNVPIGASGFACQYPYANHIDNIKDAVPFYDINFDPIAGQYFPLQPFGNIDIDKWKANCIIGSNWGKYLSDSIKSNAKIITGYFRFSITDIYKLDFQSEYIFENYSMKLSKITDWNVNGDGICEVKLIPKL